MQDRVTIFNDADEKKNTLDRLYFFIIWFPPNVTIINCLFLMSVSLTLNNIIEVVRNKYIFQMLYVTLKFLQLLQLMKWKL